MNESKTLSFPIENDISTSEDLRLKYRYLDLRRTPMARNFKLRHQVTMAIRLFMDGHGFYEIETLFSQSQPPKEQGLSCPIKIVHGILLCSASVPQLFKQLLMIAGVEYFQIVRCFRDEDLRADRQIEFTQVDIEMSFAQPESIFQLVEPLIAKIFVEAKRFTLLSASALSRSNGPLWFGQA